MPAALSPLRSVARPAAEGMPVGANPVLGPGPATSGGVGDVDPELAAAIAASLEPNSAAVPANAE